MNGIMPVSATTPLRFAFPFLLSLLVLLVSSNSSKAIPLATYQQHLEDAITTLDTLNQMDEEETQTDYQKRLAGTLNVVRDSIPVNQSVQLDKEVWTVDNTWLHIALNEIE